MFFGEEEISTHLLSEVDVLDGENPGWTEAEELVGTEAAGDQGKSLSWSAPNM
jgi:hypothetical protein